MASFDSDGRSKEAPRKITYESDPTNSFLFGMAAILVGGTAVVYFLGWLYQLFWSWIK